MIINETVHRFASINSLEEKEEGGGGAAWEIVSASRRIRVQMVMSELEATSPGDLRYWRAYLLCCSSCPAWRNLRLWTLVMSKRLEDSILDPTESDLIVSLGFVLDHRPNLT